MDQHEFNMRKVAPLLGCTITKVLQSENDGTGEQSYGFHAVNAETGRAYDVWVDMDEEGNGPGHLAVEKAK